MKKRILWAFLAMGALSTLAAGGAAEEKAPEKPERPVKIALLKGPSGVGLIDLMEHPPLAERGVAVETAAVGAPKVLLGQLINEEWDFASLPANMAAVLFNKGVPYEVAALTGQGNLYLIAPRSEGSLSPADLTGRTLYLPGKNTTPDLVMQLLAQAEGAEPLFDYRFNPSDLAKAMAAGVADLAVLPEPMATLAVTKNPELAVAADLQELWAAAYPENPLFPITVLVVRRGFREDHPALTRELLQAASASVEWVNARPAEAAELVKKHGFPLPPAIVEKAIPRSNLGFWEGEEAAAAMDPYLREIFRINPAAIGGALPGDGLYLKK